MIGRDAMRRYFISLLLLLIGTSLAFAQPFTRRSSQMQHDGLKKDLRDLEFPPRRQVRSRRSLEMGKRRRGRHDAGIARRRQAANRLHRDRHAAPQCGRRDHQRGRHQLLLFRRLHRYVRAVGQGYGAVRWRTRSSARAGRSIPIAITSSWSIRSGPGAPASRPTGSASSFRSTATTTWCRPTIACCATS